MKRIPFICAPEGLVLVPGKLLCRDEAWTYGRLLSGIWEVLQLA